MAGGKADRPRPGEFELIAELFAPLARKAAGAFGLTDDAALYRASPGMETVLTVDALVEGVHFLPSDPPDAIARKLLRVNLSDLAAKGARPCGYLLVMALPKETSMSWLEAFASGLAEDQARFGLSLWGGDTVSTSGPLTLSLTAIGEVEEGAMLPRGGAKAGDRIYVSGTIGDAALGLAVLQDRLPSASDADRAFLADRYRLPQPRTTLGPLLSGLVHAALDVSDGLVADLMHMCETSGLAATIRAADVPLSSAAAAALVAERDVTFASLLTGGDDYELLLAVPSEAEEAFLAAAAGAGVPVALIGHLEDRANRMPGTLVRVVDADEAPIDVPQPGFRHF